MPSPFPGMDPYIEASGMWSDFHGSLLAAIRTDLNAHLPDGYAASIELFVWTGDDESGSESDGTEPDVVIREGKKETQGARQVASTVAPLTIILPRPAPRKRRYVKIVEVRSKKVLTVIEVLSPSNKKGGDDRALYIEKRNEYLASHLSFVEIDLLRRGRRPPLGSRHPDVTDYYALVCKSWEFPRAGFWTFGLRDPIPSIPVPVTKALGDTLLDLRSCIDQAYDGGRYSSLLPYDEPLKPNPREQDIAWIGQVINKRRR
jgi:hypothetical protein